jgi:two-component system, chemotaxis family, response regulator Rcp1
MSNSPPTIDILLVEDDPADVLLTKRALQDNKMFNTLHVVGDGLEALEFLRGEGLYKVASRPDLILLDLNMPRMDGRELLKELNTDSELRRIPVVVLTTSDADQDIFKSFDLQASCFITKPASLGQFTRVVAAIEDFWLAVEKPPGK